jgi:mannose-1-phosphate guanylyltransferase
LQALVLAGGEGTRLRPLTLSVPKPVMPLAGRPFLTFMLDWLERHGVDEAILSCGFLSDAVERVLGERYGGIALRYVVEEKPLGTAGPVRLAADMGLLGERLLVLNGDALTDIDLTAELAQHEATGAVATLALVAVDETISYGVVPTGDDLRVEAFLEKTAAPPTNRINAGAYVLEREMVERIPTGRAVSFELETFPELIGHGLYGYPADGYWIDIGTPERYLEATYDLLAGRVESTLPPRDETGSLVAEGCITSGARIGPMSVLGHHCSVGDGSTVERSVLHDDVRVGVGCTVTGAVLAQGVHLEDAVVVEEGAIVGAGASVSAGCRVERGASLDPGAVVGGGQPVGPK